MQFKVKIFILIAISFIQCKEKTTVSPENSVCKISSFKEFTGQELKVSTQTKYDNTGKKLEVSSLIDGTKSIFEYQNKKIIIKFFDKNNVITLIQNNFLNDNNQNESVEIFEVLNGKEILTNKIVYTYHANKKLATSSRYNSQNQLSYFYSYDENGKFLEVKRNWDYNPILERYFYNSEGYQIKYEETKNGITTTNESVYEFNQNNNVSKKLNYINKVIVGYIIYEYSLNQTTENYFDTQNVIQYKVLRNFDSLNRVISEINTFYSNGKFDYEYKKIFEYNLDKLVKIQLIYPNDNNRNSTVISIYDKYQNIISTTSYDYGNNVLTRSEYTYNCI